MSAVSWSVKGVLTNLGALPQLLHALECVGRMIAAKNCTIVT